MLAHRKNKFCLNCNGKRGDLFVNVARVRGLPANMEELVVNSSEGGVWSVSPHQLGSARFRVINNTAGCCQPRLIIFESQPPTLQWGLQWAPIPPDWVHGNMLHLYVSRGTLVPAADRKRARPANCPGGVLPSVGTCPALTSGASLVAAPGGATLVAAGAGAGEDIYNTHAPACCQNGMPQAAAMPAMCGQFAVGSAQYAAAGGAVQLSNLPVAPAACVPANFQVHNVPDASGMPVQYAMAAVPQGQYPVAAAQSYGPPAARGLR